MKRKITLFSALMMVAGVTVAQKSEGVYSFGAPQPAIEKLGETKYVMKPVTIVNQQAYQKTLNELYFEDFSTGYTAGTGGVLFSTDNGDYVGDGPNTNYWSTSTAATVFGSTMGMDGRYLLWNSTSISNEMPNYSSTPVNGAVRTPSMDFSGVSNAEYVLTFNTTSEYCCHPQEFPWVINASTDGGTTFAPTGIMLDFGVARQISTNALATPLAYSVDISSLLNADPAQNNDVVLEFRWLGDNIFEYASGAFQYNTFAIWGLDNVSVFEKPEYEIALDLAWNGDIIADFEFSEIPVSQAGNFIAQAKLLNNGSSIPTGVALKVTVMEGMTEVATATGGTLIHNFANGNADTITFDTGIDMGALGLGNYTIVFEVEITETDAIMTNNTATRSLRITQNTLASFNAELPRGGESPGFFYSGDPQTTSSEMQFGNLYQFDENVSLHGVELSGHPGFTGFGTRMGEELSVYVYRAGQTAYEYHAGPFTYTVENAKISTNGQTRYVYNLHQPDVTSESGEVMLMAGELYLVVFQHFGGDGSHFFYWGTPFDHDLSSRMEGPFGTGGASGWFLMDEEPVMALNFNQALNLSENQILTSSMSLYPNPASDNATIAFSLANESAVSVEVRDLAGKLIYASNEGQLAAGSHTLNLSTATMAEGMYTYTLSANGAQVTKKFIVKK